MQTFSRKDNGIVAMALSFLTEKVECTENIRFMPLSYATLKYAVLVEVYHPGLTASQAYGETWRPRFPLSGHHYSTSCKQPPDSQR